jgi:glycosyltransferase involved in cell wall biosynthesis
MGPAPATPRRRALMGLQFFPRGGSAQVVRSLARALPEHGWDVTIASGSVSVPGRPGDARAFFAGLDVRPVDFTAALTLDDPLRGDPPLHPSYEDRPGEPDRVFARVDDELYELQVAAWADALAAAGAADADVLHLHHLTPLHEAARRVAPDVPVVGHLHGTETLMLDAIDQGPPPGWTHAAAWRDRMRGWAARCARLIVLTPPEVDHAAHALSLPADRFVPVPNGVDVRRFDRRPVDRVAHWRRYLVDDPRGWRPGGEAGGVGYDADVLEQFAEGVVLLYVGRYTEVKRVELLIRAHARARPRMHRPAPLVLVGGFPGEWEGRHPIEVIEEVGSPDVFLAGWHEQEELPDSLNAADLLVLPSVRERFGQVLVEAMACGVPPVAVDRMGPATIVDDGETGWLVPPDDEQALADALVAAVDDDTERRRRGGLSRTAARDRYSWVALAGRVAETYAAVS